MSPVTASQENVVSEQGSGRTRVAALGVLLGAAACVVTVGCRGVLGIDTERDVLDGDEGTDAGAEIFGGSDRDATTTRPGLVDNTREGGDAGAGIDGDAGVLGDSGEPEDGSTEPSELDGTLADAGSDDASTAPAETLEWANWPLAPDSPPGSNFVVNGNTVRDTTTGLVWQRGMSEPMPYARAAAYCEELREGGASDWRLPSWIELVSTIDFGRTGTAFSPVAFTDRASAFLWSHTPLSQAAGTNGLIRVVYAFSGVTAFVPPETTERARARCVRGRPFVYDRAPGAPEGRYEVTEGTVHDTKTGLTWQRGVAPPPRVTYEAAAAYCDALAIEGHEDFRVPTMRELLSIVDVDAPAAPMWDPVFGSSAPSDLWSQTIVANTRNGERWGLQTVRAEANQYPTIAPSGVKCVRGGASPVAGDGGLPIDPDLPDAATAPSASSEWANWPLPPTSPGEGAYEILDGDSVRDKVTGLVWHRALSESVSQEEAEEHCMGLRASGHSDWRLPTWIELVSLVDYARTPPSIAPVAFPNTGGAIVRTRSQNVLTPSVVLGVSFAAGEVVSISPTRNAFTRARCVRGAPLVHNRAPGAPPGRYELTREVARDRATGLVWQRSYAPAVRLSFDDASRYCASLALDGRQGFRLPTVRELLSLVDVDAFALPQWDQTAFATVGPGDLWSQTDVPGSRSSERWAVQFTSGTINKHAPTARNGARCVADGR
jgi:hypothetical protein